jgi:hypothetical protein
MNGRGGGISNDQPSVNEQSGQEGRHWTRVSLAPPRSVRIASSVIGIRRYSKPRPTMVLVASRSFCKSVDCVEAGYLGSKVT